MELIILLDCDTDVIDNEVDLLTQTNTATGSPLADISQNNQIAGRRRTSPWYNSDYNSR